MKRSACLTQKIHKIKVCYGFKILSLIELPNINIKKLDRLVSDALAKNQTPEKILLGYKTYGELMKDRKFFEDVAGSAMDPNKRTYKKIKIRVTQDDYQFEIKCSN